MTNKAMHLQTLVPVPDFPFHIQYHNKIMFIGSCFANNIGQKFAERKLNTLINPFGVLYNPMSVCQCIDAVVTNHFNQDLIIQHDEVWHSLAHHSTFSNTSKLDCINSINENLASAHQQIKNCDFLFLTLGTAQVFEKDGQVVSNCHKMPTNIFTRRRLNVDEIIEQMAQSIKALRAINPKIKIIFTVSPVRYAKDGMHENTLNKANLHLAIDHLCRDENCFYLPAYEIVLDELRDYRFFAQDMTHPNELAIDYLWEKIASALFSNATQDLCKQVIKIITASKHRPFNTNPKAHETFLTTMLKKASDLQQQHPEIDLSEEIGYFSTK